MRNAISYKNIVLGIIKKKKDCDFNYIVDVFSKFLDAQDDSIEDFVSDIVMQMLREGLIYEKESFYLIV